MQPGMKLTVGQRKVLAEFYANGAVAWMTVGIATPLLAGQSLLEALGPFVWGMFFTILFLGLMLTLTKGVRT